MDFSGFCLRCFLVFIFNGSLFTLYAQKETPELPWLKRALPLSDRVEESSGIFFTEQGLWTYNDSGGEAEFYLIDTASGFLKHTVKVQGAKNVDWEAACICHNYLFTGDIGNNQGKRQDLKIYKTQIPDTLFSLIPVKDEIEIQWSALSEQAKVNKDYDSEAMLCYDKGLILLNKPWNTGILRAGYIAFGKPLVWVEDSMQPGILVSDAIFLPWQGKQYLLLLGYENKLPGDVYLWVIQQEKNISIFKGERVKILLGNAFILGQAEGLAYDGDKTLFLSAEKFGIHKTAVLHSLDWEVMLDRFWIPKQE